MKTTKRNATIPQNYSVIVGLGHYTGGRKVTTEEILKEEGHLMVDDKGNPQEISLECIMGTIGVLRRTYAHPDEQVSDLAAQAIEHAFDSCIVPKEEVDALIVAHNGGDYGDPIPPLSHIVQDKVGIPPCKTFDVINGCPGWITAADIADSYIKESNGIKVVVSVGVDILSRIKGDGKNSLIFSDGAGCAIFMAERSEEPTGIVAKTLMTDGSKHDYITLGPTLRASERISRRVSSLDYQLRRVIKMKGYKVYSIAKQSMAKTYFELLSLTELEDDDVHLVIPHQASMKIINGTSDEIVKGLYGKNIEGGWKAKSKEYKDRKIPISLDELGNNSAATIPVVMSQIYRNEIDGFSLEPDMYAALLSAGASISWGGILAKMHPLLWDLQSKKFRDEYSVK